MDKDTKDEDEEMIEEEDAEEAENKVVEEEAQVWWLRLDKKVSQLNIIFVNCSGQNNNNTVLRLATWLMAMNCLKEVVGHIQNAADHLYNCLKTEYHKQNLFTFQDLVETLNRSDTMMVSIQQLWRTFLNMTNYWVPCFGCWRGT